MRQIKFLLTAFLLIFSLKAEAATNIVATLSDDVSLNYSTFAATIWDGTTLTNETSNFTKSGNATVTTYTLMAANRTATFDYDETISLNLTIADSTGNYINYASGATQWTVESSPLDPVSDVFSTGSSGDRNNWTEKVWDGSVGIWNTYEDNLDATNVEYGTSGTFTGGNDSTSYQPGAIAIYPVTISGNSVITCRIKAFGDVSSGTTPIDMTFITGASNIGLNLKESTFIRLNAIPGATRFGYYDTDGVRQTQTQPGGKSLTDNQWHRLEINIGTNEGDPWVIKIDDVTFFTGDTQGSPDGYFAFGSDNDSVRIDGIEIQGGGTTETPPIEPSPIPVKGRISMTNSQVRKSDRVTFSGKKSGRIRFT